MAEESKVICPVCENEVGTKDDGTRIRAHKVAGERCGGSDELVVSDDVASTGLDRGDPFDELEASQVDDESSDDQNGDEHAGESRTGTQGVASSETSPDFVHVVVVANPCPYLDDEVWHHQNIRMAVVEAQRAGHVPAGPEPTFAGAEVQGDRIVLRYSVVVK